MKKKNISIIVIDDDIRTRITLEEIFEEAGYTVECFRTGNEGVKRILNNNIDIAIIDVRLPDTSGLDVLKLIKEYQPKTCCIVLTAYPNVEDAVKALKTGAYDYIEKPIDPSEIKRVIEELVNKGVVSPKEIEASRETYRGKV